MSAQFWWYVSRSAGIVAWLFITASVIWGIVLSTDLFARRRRPAWLLDLHRGLGALSIVSLGIHLAALVADNFVHFDLIDLVVPFASEWKTWQVALGVFAFWGLVVVEATSLLMRRLPRRLWHTIHLTSYATFFVGSLHGTFAGTDATSTMYVATSISTTAVLVLAICYRILTRGRARVPRRHLRTPSDVVRPDEADSEHARPDAVHAGIESARRTSRGTIDPLL
ncbi:MAG: hypothetical protein ABJH68_20600 [Ilumatobacter sp.]|uniref:hypothetical protein n=1 Tax=Ilumatobacter sp. TaxID=1967498 RepID=UPI003296B46D